jgi:hypothetical protein
MTLIKIIMKKIIAPILLLFSIMVSAQNDPVKDTTAQPAITKAGKPNGKIAEKKMNKDGGTLVSTDGSLELIIPPGALSKKTTISIQPITNMFSNGNGPAYRLEPSGIQFQKPVQLVFHYTPEESADSMQLLMGIAMQDSDGQWCSLRKFTLDTIAKTISGNISHFSDWSKFDALKLTPSSARLKVRKALYLEITGVEPSPKDEGDGELVKLERKPKSFIWSVNNIRGGSAKVGVLKFQNISNDNQYTAPSQVPELNPVAVTVKLEGLKWKFNGTTFNTLRLVSNILIYDNAYEVTMISSMKGYAGSVAGNVTYKDTGSFVVSLDGREAKIIEKINKNLPDELNYEGQCTLKQLKPGSGNIHIMGTAVVRVIRPASPTQTAMIEIVFRRAPVMFPLIQFTCPDQRGGTFTTTNAQANAMAAAVVPAFPQHIKFEAKEEEQVILKIGEEGSEIYTKFTVKQLPDD